MKPRNICMICTLLLVIVGCQSGGEIETTAITKTLEVTVPAASVETATVTFEATTTTIVESANLTQVPETLAPTETLPPSPSPSPTDIPSPRVLPAETRTIHLPQEPIEEKGVEGVRYAFQEYVRSLERLPDGNYLALTENEEGIRELSVVDFNQTTITPILGDVHPKIMVSQDAQLFVAVDVPPEQLFPIWAVVPNLNEPVLLGVTSGYGSPLFSTTSDGRVLLFENDELVLKWVENGLVQSQSLEFIEEQLGLNWSSNVLSQRPDYEKTTLADLSISPDGKWIALFDGLQGKLWITSIDGEIIKDIDFHSIPVSPGRGGSWVTFRDWSPDSRLLGYQATVWLEDPKGYEYFSNLQIVSTDNSSLSTINPGGSYGVHLAWSPAGENLAFQARDSHGQQHLYIADKDGSNPQELPSIYLGDSGKTLFWQNDTTLNYKCQLPDIEIWQPNICIVHVEK